MDQDSFVCSDCGADVNGGDAACKKCGATLDWASEEVVQSGSTIEQTEMESPSGKSESKEPKVRSPVRAGFIFLMGLLSVLSLGGIVFGVAAVVLGQLDLIGKGRGSLVLSSPGLTAAGRNLGIVGVLLAQVLAFPLGKFSVPTGGMEDEIMAGDNIIVNRMIRSVEPGDVVIFEFPGQRDETEPAEMTYYVKRVVALAGDSVEIRNRVVYLNGHIAENPRKMKFNHQRIKQPNDAEFRIFPKGSAFNEDNWGPMKVPKMGDVIHLNSSNLDQWLTFIGREGHSAGVNTEGAVTIDGRSSETYTVEQNYFFCLGDNRDNSLDSRYWGFVPEGNVFARPLIVYWSWDEWLPSSDFMNKIASIRFDRIGVLIR